MNEECCSVAKNLLRRRCGRDLHQAPDGVDEQPVCLMHSKDPRKVVGGLYRTFLETVDAILAEAGEGQASFDGYVFPRLDLHGREFVCSCDFSEATFIQGADLTEVTFVRDATFFKTQFIKDADFRFTTFMRNAFFNEAVFSGEGFFRASRFMQEAYFEHAEFLRDADFESTFFEQKSYFRGTVFKSVANYAGARFWGEPTWYASRFLGNVLFRGTSFDASPEDACSGRFALADFSSAESVVFDNVDLSRVSFHNCDVSRVWFTTSTRWGKTSIRRAIVFEERSSPEMAARIGSWVDHSYEGTSVVGGHRDYQAIAQIYQQLKKSYDARLDYWTADELHFGEMEMKRLDVPRSGSPLGPRKWWHKHLSLVALYRWGSSYGNSYRRPLLWLAGVLVTFAFLFPVAGLLHTVGEGAAVHVWVETFGSAWKAGVADKRTLSYELAVLGHGFLTAVDAATFQRNAEYTPAFPWGRVLAIAETLLTSTLAGLFLLAVRRQFRR